jgi:SNF2 family DNA or RNA helicase
MPKLSIDFDPVTLDALLSSDQPGSHWESIRRVCQDKFQYLGEVTSQSLTLPWWAFLSGREAIGFHVAQYDLDVEVTLRAKEELDRAIRRVEQLASAAQVPPLSEAEVMTGLAQGGFIRELKSFQVINIRKLARLDIGATFSVPGAGKTTEALAFFTLKKTPDSRLLVVAPKNAFAAWEEQLGLCLGKSETFHRLIQGRTGVERILGTSPRFMLITYHLFANVSDLLSRYLTRYDSFIFLDESHRIKGGLERVMAAAILQLAPLPRCRLIMSGTPLPNAISDLIPQISFIAPELEIDESNVEEIAKPLYVRTTKSELKLPTLNRVPRIISLAPAQRALYELMRSEAARQAEQMLTSRSRNAFRRIGRSAIRLLQFTSNPALLAKKDFEYDQFLSSVLEEGDSPKLIYACARARRLAQEGKKVIIWSSFVENVELVAERLLDLGADYIHGGVEASSDAEANSREAKIKRFHDDDQAMVLVANPAACSEGISLHSVCNHSIYIDRNYNAAQYIQSEDRIHRIGSQRPVIEEIIVAPDTVDESVQRRLSHKINAMAAVLNDANLRIDPFSFDLEEANPDEEDVLDILRHLKQAVVPA